MSSNLTASARNMWKKLKSWLRWRTEIRRLDREADRIIAREILLGIENYSALDKNNRKWIRMVTYKARKTTR